MKITELRLGNYIHIRDNKVIKVDIGTLIDIETHQGLFSPIPLTEEWLVDFGFSPTTCSDKPNWSYNYHDLTYYDLQLNEDKYYDLSLLSSYIENEDIYVELFPYNNPKVKFVHELQNLYFALTGKELITK